MQPTKTTTTEYRVVRPVTGEYREAEDAENAVKVATTWARIWNLDYDELVIETRVVTATEWTPR